MMYKICHNFSDLNFHIIIFHIATLVIICANTTRPFSLSLILTHNQFKNFFINRILDVWNKLFRDIVSTPSLSSFKIRVKKFDLDSITSLVY